MAGVKTSVAIKASVPKDAIERPILFSGPMVKAILEGRKTQTRRVIKPQPPDWCKNFGWTAFTPKGHISGRGNYADQGPAEKFFRMVHGVPGDQLWVRETWAPVGERAVYRADFKGEVTKWHPWPNHVDPEAGALWKSSMFMPRRASRIALEITGVRVQRLTEISEEDARAEGVEPWPEADLWPNGDLREGPSVAYSAGFHDLWDSLNAKRGYGWATNPWVWAITFRTLTGDSRA